MFELPDPASIPMALYEARYIRDSKFYRYMGPATLYSEEELNALLDFFRDKDALPGLDVASIHYATIGSSGWSTVTKKKSLNILSTPDAHFIAYTPTRSGNPFADFGFDEKVEKFINDMRGNTYSETVPNYEF